MLLNRFWIAIVFFGVSILEVKAIKPLDNPVSNYGVAWTNGFLWNQVLSIEEVEGYTLDERVQKGQELLVERGGGVLYFPEGIYEFVDHIYLKKGIVLRGSDPLNSEKHNPIVPNEFPKAFIDAREPRYTLGTFFVFPDYRKVCPHGEASCADEAFKGIRLEDPQTADYAGVVNIHISHGHIALGEKLILQENYRSQQLKGHFLVYGCILTHTAVAKMILVPGEEQKKQIWIDREYGAITVYGCQNILIANNRIPRSPDGGFMMKDYQLFATEKEWKNNQNKVTRQVWFDYDNRTGIRVNFLPMLHQLKIWNIHKELDEAVKDGTYEQLITPGTLARGIVIRNNYVYSTGGGGIKTTGDGAWVAFNIIKTEPGVVLTTANGLYMDAHVNEVRGIEMRGWHWTVEGNDYEVHSNYTPDGIKYNDGEGIMHEAWENVGVRESKIINNTGNRYICFWRVPVRGLLVEGNRTRIKPNWHSVFVNAQARFSAEDLVDLPCERVVIRNNVTEGGGIKLLGEDGEGNRISNNRHTLINEGFIHCKPSVQLRDNRNYELRIVK